MLYVKNMTRKGVCNLPDITDPFAELNDTSIPPWCWLEISFHRRILRRDCGVLESSGGQINCFQEL